MKRWKNRKGKKENDEWAKRRTGGYALYKVLSVADWRHLSRLGSPTKAGRTGECTMRSRGPSPAQPNLFSPRLEMCKHVITDVRMSGAFPFPRILRWAANIPIAKQSLSSWAEPSRAELSGARELWSSPVSLVTTAETKASHILVLCIPKLFRSFFLPSPLNSEQRMCSREEPNRSCWSEPRSCLQYIYRQSSAW